MPTDLSDTLVVGIAATALFDLREADAFFQASRAAEPATALQAYRQHMLEREHEPLADGSGMALVRALLGLNRFQQQGDSRALVEVVVLSRNSSETGLRVLHAIRERALPIVRHAFTGGESVVDYLEAFSVDLFLTTNPGDAQRVIDSGLCAAALLKAPPHEGQPPPEDQVRIAFDGDAVLFADASEVVYKQQGLATFQA
ncbi:MAG: 5'-nucleotidase, partial [Cyanobacteriota bacterium]|nr:5'-nucleotidase [Cyanobacteriota bacterium]